MEYKRLMARLLTVPSRDRKDKQQKSSVCCVRSPPQLAQCKCHGGEGDVHCHVRQWLHRIQDCLTSCAKLSREGHIVNCRLCKNHLSAC